MTGAPLAGFLDVLPPECSVLRPHQTKQIGQVSRAIRAGDRRILVQLATGGGKTHEIASIALAAQRSDLRVLILATRTRLVRQISERLDAFRVPHGIIAASLPQLTNAAMTVQVASADTLHRRCLVNQRRPLPSADCVVFDEAHLAVADSRLAILEQYPEALHLGFTATPARKSGRSLAAGFDCLIRGPSVLALINAGLLVRPRVFSAPLVTAQELKELPTDNSSDYATGALSELLSRPRLVGDVVQNWLRLASGRRTLLFACSKSHGAQLVEEFCRAGVCAELLTDEDDDDAREAAIERLESGETKILASCHLLTVGIDVPAVDAIVLARPTRSIVMYLQAIGRGLRTAPGKEDCLIIDHGRCVETLGFPTTDYPWSLDGRSNVNHSAIKAQSRKSGAERPRVCPECSHTWLVSELGEACDSCGWKPRPKPKGILVEQADLAEVDESEVEITSSSVPVMRFFCEALGDYARAKPDKWMNAENTARAACWYATKEKFKLTDDRLPQVFWRLPPATPTVETSSWLKYRRIKFAKSQRAVA